MFNFCGAASIAAQIRCKSTKSIKFIFLGSAEPAPLHGSLFQKFAEDNNIKCPALSCGALNLADYLLSSAKYLMVLTIWLV